MVFTIAKKKKDFIRISFVDSPSSEDVTGSLIYISTPNHKFLVDAGLYQTNDRYEDFLVNNRKYKEFKPKELDVTGSLIYISTPNHKFLVDAGLYQTNDRYEDFLVNNRKYKEFKPKELDYVFITHSHSDHMNLLPKLFKDGCNARVIITEGTSEIIKDMMTDCAEINERDVHSHSDHMNLLPKLFKDGCNARVIITEGTSEIIKDMMTDCAEINERDVVIINNQHDKQYEALYDIDDVHNTMNHIVEFPMKEKIKIDDELSFELIPSGHLLGSCQVLLYLTVNNITKTVLVTGDIGNKIVGNRFVGEYKQVKNADYVIAESTYGDKPDIKTGRKERKNDLEKFKSIIDTQIHDLKGRVIIPSFAQSRSAQLVLMVYQLYKDSDWKPKVYIDSPLAIKLFKDYENCLIPSFAQSRSAQLVLMVYQLYKDSDWKPKVYIDSPLAIKLFKDYENCLDGKDKEDFDEMLHSGMFHFVKEPVDSKTLVASNEPCLIISTSGMCQVGRIRHHLKKCVIDPNATVLFVGFSTDGSLASLLKDNKRKTITIDQKEYRIRHHLKKCVIDPNATVLFVGFSTDGSLASLLKDNKRKTITIDQKEYPCRCASYSLKSMSGHAPFNQLVENYTEINCQKIILHHGSKKAKEVLKQALEKEYEKKCKSTRVVIANSSLKITI